MLMIVGEYLKKINYAQSSIEGLGFNVSLEIAKHGVCVSFESLISKDDEGVCILDKLVTSEVLFDPSLCNSDLSTATYNVKNNELFFNESCSAMLSKLQLEDSISYHEDVKLIHFGSFSYYSSVTGNSILNASFGEKPKPILYFNPAISKEQIPNIEGFKDKSILALKFCTIVQITDDFLNGMYPNLDNKIDVMMGAYPRVNVLYIKNNKISYLSSLESSDIINVTKSFKHKVAKKDIDWCYSIATGAFLSSLHENEVFGDELTDPIYYPSSQSIEKALDLVVKGLS
jgi:hypothetical protein